MKAWTYGLIFMVLSFSGMAAAGAPALQQLGRWNGDFYCYNVTVYNQKAYMFDSNKMIIVDVSNPASPQKLGEITLPMDIMDLQVSGNYAYVTTYFGYFSGGNNDNDGLRIIDISNSSSPQEVSFYYIFGAKCVYVSGKYAYIGSAYLDTQFYTGGFKIVDISVPSSPQAVGGYTGSGIEDILTVNGYTYVVYVYSSRIGANGGIINFDTSNPAAPVEIERYITYSWIVDMPEKAAIPRKMSRHNNLLFMRADNAFGDAAGRMFILDISVPGAMAELSTFETPYISYGEDISGVYLYVANGNDLRVSDVSDPAAPKSAAQTYSGYGPLDVFVSGDTVYVPEGNNGLTILSASAINTSPFGTVETPVQGAVVSGSIPVSGWVLDDKGIDNVKVFRNPTSGEGNSPIFLGDAILVEGARPDVEQTFPAYPNNSKAGWGYMLLTNYDMPNQGNGPVTLTVVATDSNGVKTTLGSQTITLDNAHAEKPFGALDTPTQGGIASGAKYLNWGWALTPQPNMIPIDGSTIDVFVDGVKKGHPKYNIYRQDVAEYFPGYANSSGAVGYFYLDTTKYTDGVHTISWNVKDNAGNSDGIGSRYFTIENSNNRAGTSGIDEKTTGKNGSEPIVSSFMTGIPFHHPLPRTFTAHTEPVGLLKGYDRETKPQTLYPQENGSIEIDINPLERVEIHLEGTGRVDSSSTRWYGGQLVPGGMRALPIGSTLDGEKGIYYWQPGPGMKGTFALVFIKTSGTEANNRHLLRVTINLM